MANYDDLLNNAPAEEQSAPQLSKEEYAEMKKAAREELFNLSDQTAMEVSADGGKFQFYLDLQAHFDRYSAVNTLLILAQQDKLPAQTATRLGDFDYWEKQNAFVKEKSVISILEPQAYTKEDGMPGTGYNAKKVFDVSQVDTRKLKIAPQPTYTERQILSALISKYPMKIMGVDELAGDRGAMTNLDGEILVRRGMGFSDTFRAVAYEMAGAELATDPELSPEQEFSAYAATYLLCKKYGVDVQDFSFEDAPGIFDGMDAQEIKGELSQIRDAAENISGRMARQLEAQQRAAKSQEAR